MTPKMFQRFGERLVKELGSIGLSRLDGVTGRDEPLPIERHGGWEWTFGERLRPKDSPMHRYLMLRATLGERSATEAQKPTTTTVLVTVGADKDDRNFVRREVGEVTMENDVLENWSRDFAVLLDRAIDHLRNLTETDLTEEYSRRLSRQ